MNSKRLSLKSNSSFFIAFQNETNDKKWNSRGSFKSKSSNSLKESDMDTISEKGFKLPKKLQGFGSMYRNRTKQRSDSININPAELKDNILRIDGAMYYLSNTNGVCGHLMFTSKEISFALESNGHYISTRQRKQNSIAPKNPLIDDEDNFKDSFLIDLLNMGEIYREASNDYHTIIVYCRNFKHVKFGLKQKHADLFINHLKLLRPDLSLSNKRTCIWEFLYHHYQFKLMTDWVKHEPWYINNFKIRFSQFNEDGNCDTLPEVVIVPRDIRDIELQRILCNSVCNRVPVVTFLYRNSGHMIIRSSTFITNTLQNLYQRAICPLRELDVDSILPPINEVERNYIKLRKTCFNLIKVGNNKNIATMYDIDHSKQFWSKCGLWLHSMSRVLKFVGQLVEILQREASVGLVESSDAAWNCVLSSLVQLCVDPHRRTMIGFESLLSKEWVYLYGYKQEKSSQRHVPNPVLFSLFLDSVHQLIVQNESAFEFSTFYLTLLHDNQFAYEKFTREESEELQVNRGHPLMLNPIYVHTESPLVFNAHTSQLRLFSATYLRQLRSQTHKYTPEELLFIHHLDALQCL